jgi:hypothetical protein
MFRPTARQPPQILETTHENFTLLSTQPLIFREYLNDCANSREINIVSGGLVIATYYLLCARIDDGKKILAPNIPSDTPVERSEMIVKGVMNRTEHSLNMSTLHRNHPKLSLGLRHASSDERHVAIETATACTQGTSLTSSGFSTPLLVRNVDIRGDIRFATVFTTGTDPLSPPTHKHANVRLQLLDMSRAPQLPL